MIYLHKMLPVLVLPVGCVQQRSSPYAPGAGAIVVLSEGRVVLRASCTQRME